MQLSDTFRRIISNVGWLSLDQAVRITLGVFVTAWVARYLGPQDFGSLNYATALVALFSFLVSLGLDNITVRDLVRKSDSAGEILGTVLVLRVAGAVLLGVVCLASSYARNDSQVLTTLISLAALASFFSTINTLCLYFQAREIQKLTVYANNAAFFLFVVVRIGLIKSGADVRAFAWVQLAQAGASALFILLLFRRAAGPGIVLRPSFSRAKSLMAEAWPQIIASLSISIYMRIDQVMLTEIVGVQANGIYSTALKLSEIWYFIPTIIVPSVLPVLIKSREGSISQYLKHLEKLFSLMAALAICLALPISLLSGRLVSAVFGADYAAAGPILAVHIWASLFVFWGMAQEPWNVAEGLLKLSLVRTLLGAVINVGLNLLLIPKYAGLGAAYATLIAYCCATILGNLLARETRPVFWLQLRSLLFLRYLNRYK